MASAICSIPGSGGGGSGTGGRTTMASRLTDRVAIVTGAAHGIGRAICVALAGEGAQIWACDVLGDDLEGTREAVESATRRSSPAASTGGRGRSHTALVDVTDAARVGAFVG